MKNVIRVMIFSRKLLGLQILTQQTLSLSQMMYLIFQFEKIVKIMIYMNLANKIKRVFDFNQKTPIKRISELNEDR